MKHVLAAEKVQFAYEQQDSVLSGVTVQCPTGKLTGIVGPNGSGKSTLLRVLAGMLMPQSGAVTLDGRRLRSFRARERARMLGFLPQAVNPAFSLSVFEVVCLGRYPHTGSLGLLGPADTAVVRRCLCDAEVEHLSERPFPALSGGERQRVLLASVLAQEPELLLLDEPTSALDIHHQVEIFQLLRRLTSDGFGVAIVTHDLNLAGQYCDQLLLLSSTHQVVCCGTSEDVLQEQPLSEAYGADIRVGRHPFSETPFVAAAPGKGAIS